MPQLRFRNFSSLTFLQSIDKPRFLAPLLAGHAEFFARHGVDVAALTNDDSCARLLLAALTTPDENMPGTLLRDLYVLDELADEDGHQRIFDEAGRRGIDLGQIPDDVSAGDFAVLVLLQHPHLIRVCHEKMVVRQVKRYYEYRSQDDRRFAMGDVEAGLGMIRATLGPWFAERKRTSTCELFTYEEGGEIRVLLTHGGLFRSDGSITSHLELSRLGWRPQKHDSVIYDTGSGILRIHASYEPERNAYREAFGSALAGSAAFFVDAAPYSLESLRSTGGVLTLVDGLDSARLTEVLVEMDGTDCRQIQLKGDDLAESIAACGEVVVPPGEIVRACFALGYRSGGRDRKLEIRLPNVAEYDRDRDGNVTEAFLRANSFLVTSHADADGLVDAA